METKNKQMGSPFPKYLLFILRKWILWHLVAVVTFYIYIASYTPEDPKVLYMLSSTAHL